MNRVHPTAIIGPGVDVGDDNIIGPHAVLYGPTILGDRNWIAPHVVIGAPGESRGNDHPPLWDAPGPGQPIVIGNDNLIHEFVAIQASVHGQTRIGDGCFIMDKAHVPHDAQLGDGVTVACAVMIGGHSLIGAGANLGLSSVTHQFSVVGAGAMIGMGAVVTKHVPPFAIAYGAPARVKGANKVGMARAGMADDVIERVHASLAAGEIPTDTAAEIAPALAWFRDAVARNER